MPALTATHNYSSAYGGSGNYGGVLWDSTRYFGAGLVKVRPTDYTLTYKDGGSGTDQWYTIRWDWMEVEFGIYARQIGNRVLDAPQLVGSKKVARKTWNVEIPRANATVLTSSAPAGRYSFWTRPVRFSRSGTVYSFGPGVAAGQDWALKVSFNAAWPGA